jgi:hypothetical protein
MYAGGGSPRVLPDPWYCPRLVVMLRQFFQPRVLWAPRDSGWWIASTFIVGSVLFGLGAAFPLISGFPVEVINLVYLAGSSLYLIGASVQFVQGRRMKINDRGDAAAVRRFANRNSRAAAIQAFGAILFQTSMTGALINSLNVAQQERVIWAPDLVGAICFVTASTIFFTLRYPIQQRRDNRQSARFLALLNIIGSAFFVLSAIGAYIVPLTDQSLYPQVANIGTFVGAIFFFVSSIPGLPPREKVTTAG